MLNLRKTYNIAGVTVPAFLFILFFILTLAACLLTIEYSYYVPIVIIGSVVLFYSLKNILLGICIFISFHTVILVQSKEITMVEIIFFLYFLLLFSSWFFQRILLERKRIVKEKPDYILVLFFAIVFLSLIPALINKVYIVDWFRELIPFLTFVIYFIVAAEVKNQKHSLLLLSVLCAVTLFFAAKNIFLYRNLLSGAQYFWEIASSRQVLGEIFFVTNLMLGFSFLFSPVSKKAKTFLIIFTIIIGGSLAITFSRGYWLAFILGMFILFFLLNKKEKISYITYMFIFLFIAVVGAYILIGDIFEFVWFSLAERFPTLKQVSSDISILNRISEAKGILGSIKYYFVAGAGLGAEFKYFDIIDNVTANTWYSHNAFLYFIYKLGLPGLITFLLFYFSIIKYGIEFIKTESNAIENPAAKGTVALFIAMFFLSISSPQFYQKDSILIIALLGGLIRNFHERYYTRKIEVDNK